MGGLWDMNEKLMHYFANLNNDNYQSNGDCILAEDEHIRPISICKYDIDGNKFYSKKPRCDKYAISEIATSQMYNSIRFATPPIYIMKNSGTQQISLLSQDVNTLDDNLEFAIATNIIDKDPFFKNAEYSRPTNIIFDMDVREKWQSIMTNECIEQFILMFLLDEIRTECDRFGRNYFFYRGKGQQKWEGVIAIDNELMYIITPSDNKFATKEGFQSFLSLHYPSHSMTGKHVHLDYESRIEDVKSLIYFGKLTNKQISTLKLALDFDLPKHAQTIQQKYNLQASAHECIQRLWDYHHGSNGLSREL